MSLLLSYRFPLFPPLLPRTQGRMSFKNYQLKYFKNAETCSTYYQHFTFQDIFFCVSYFGESFTSVRESDRKSAAAVGRFLFPRRVLPIKKGEKKRWIEPPRTSNQEKRRYKTVFFLPTGTTLSFYERKSRKGEKRECFIGTARRG